MKKIISVVVALSLLLVCVCACAETDAEAFAKLPDDVAVSYSSILEYLINGTEAILNPDGALTDEELEELTVDLLLYKDCASFGYAITDLDGDGNYELIVAADTDDEYFTKMVFAVYTYVPGEDGEYEVRTVLEAGERDSFWYAGGNRFYEEGSCSADESIVTTWAYRDGKLEDLGVVTDPANFVQMDLIPAYPIP